MARPVEYDLQKVLDNAMELFWQKGYENVSMAEIVTHTGLNRRTMYSLFVDKEGLFRDALDNYYTQRAANMIAILKNNPGKKGIELFMQNFSFNKNFKGCLFNNCMEKGELMDESLFSIPKNYFSDLRMQFEKNLSEASSLGEFSGDAKALALTIITIIHGFNIYGKYNHSTQDGELIIKNILDMIK